MSVETIKKLYNFLNNLTPLVDDCGRICNHKCCKGEMNDGMLLLPGEKELLEQFDCYSFYYDEKYESDCVRCEGVCNRDFRPFSCRIFPYFIYKLNEESDISIAPDIRAYNFCPLIDKKYSLNKKYLRNMRICSKIIDSDEELRKYFIKISFLLTDFIDL